MSTPARAIRARRRPLSRPFARAAALAAGAVALFLVGMAVGRATDDREPAGTRTLERTLRVDTLTPAVETVTVTVERGG